MIIDSFFSIQDERGPKYLFIDNIEPSEIVVSFSVLPRWSGSETDRDKKMSDKESVTGASEGMYQEFNNATLANSISFFSREYQRHRNFLSH